MWTTLAEAGDIVGAVDRIMKILPNISMEHAHHVVMVHLDNLKAVAQEGNWIKEDENKLSGWAHVAATCNRADD